MLSKRPKAQFSETEAAAEIGISVQELRVLIRDHITGADEPFTDQNTPAFQHSDIVLLRILANSHRLTCV